MSETQKTNEDIMQEAQQKHDNYDAAYVEDGYKQTAVDEAIVGLKGLRREAKQAYYSKEKSKLFPEANKKVDRASSKLHVAVLMKVDTEDKLDKTVNAAATHFQDNNGVYFEEARNEAMEAGVKITVQQPDEFVQPVQIPVDFKLGPK